MNQKIVSNAQFVALGGLTGAAWAEFYPGFPFMFFGLLGIISSVLVYQQQRRARQENQKNENHA